MLSTASVGSPALRHQEIEAELLEVAGEAGGEQPLPLVARLEAVAAFCAQSRPSASPSLV